MAATTRDLSDVDIDRLLFEAEARLLIRVPSNALQALQPLADVPLEPAKKPNSAARETVLNNSGIQVKDVTLRIPKLEEKKKSPAEDAGPDWGHLPRTKLTPELKRDLQVLRMRSVLSMGKQYFKKDNKRGKIPEFCAMGTIIEGRKTDGGGDRLTRKQRKRTIVEEVLAGDMGDKFKQKYGEIQKRKMSGKKRHYQKLVERRRRKG